MGPAVSTFVCGTGQYSGVQGESIGISLGNTSYYTFIGVPLQLVLALALALLLNIKVRGLAIYRTLFYLPAMTPIVASAIVWLQILHPEFGILNSFLRNFGIEPVNWLFDPRAAKPALILMTRGGPQNATLFLVLYLYRNGFQYFKMGYASAIAWMLFVIIVAFTVIQFRLASRWVHEEGAPA